MLHVRILFHETTKGRLISSFVAGVNEHLPQSRTHKMHISHHLQWLEMCGLKFWRRQCKRRLGVCTSEAAYTCIMIEGIHMWIAIRKEAQRALLDSKMIMTLTEEWCRCSEPIGCKSCAHGSRPKCTWAASKPLLYLLHYWGLVHPCLWVNQEAIRSS